MKNQKKTVLYAKNFYLQQELRGIMDFAREHDWQLEIPQMYGLPRYVRNWHGAGLLTDTAYCTQILHDKGVKIVALSLEPKLVENADAVVAPDNRRLGEIAAEYFLSRGYHNFAASRDVYGRDNAFALRVEREGFSAIRIEMPRYFRSPQALQVLADGLRRLPTPCAVFCNNDWEAASMLNAASLAGVPVPDGISIIGVGNEELICTMTSPPLSSIATQLYQRGMCAAEELNRVMEGGAPRKEPILVEPGLVVERESSDFFAIGDKKLRKMLEYLRKRATSPVQVAELRHRFRMSESKIYRLFREGIGLSPKEFLSEVRLNLARGRLIDSDDTINTIAVECGFPSPGALFEHFRARYGKTPADWREENRWK